ncbi:hypothetical protein F511_37462 [Dorcoceras hygrometricum]|uniref:Uncharacterized protein n=1 Tax=Dorcoceras hygrometricum TaxID=472368 RepID=A0A2Z7CQU3_9LAMI|nr:hypothetical protein F511_37462 [Dorcoceras hygrometricum]
MDLKGKSWVGSIYHKFEAICQEVEDFVSKDTMKYVENQAQSIGVSVKKLYSDGVQDEIPPVKDDMKPETHLVLGEEANRRYQDTPIPSNITKLYSDEKRLPVKQDSGDIQKKCDISLSDVSLVTSPTMTHTETNHGVSLKEDCDTMVRNDSSEGVQEKISTVMRLSSNNKVLSMISNEENKENHDECNTTLAMVCSPSLSVHEADLLASKQEGSICHKFPDEAEYFLNVPTNGRLSEDDLPLFLEFSLEEDKSSPEPLEASADKGHLPDSSPMDSATLLDSDAAQKPSQTCETLHNSFSTKEEHMETSNAVQSSETVVSYCSHDDAKAESCVISSSQYTPSISLNLLDSESAYYTLTEENIVNTPVGYNGYNHHISVVHACSTSSATLSNEIKAGDMLTPLSVIKSNVSVSSETQNTQYFKGAQSTLLMSTSETGISCLDIGDLNMETIDLSADATSDVFNTNFHRATLSRQKNFRYYKKLFKDAFSSRKRLSKEYEHLVLLHGDINMESKQFLEPRSLPPSTASLNMARSLPSHKSGDSDWEVL